MALSKVFSWEVKPKAPETMFQKFPQFSSLVVQLLYNRGLTEQGEIDKFLTPDYQTDQNDPFLFVDAEKAKHMVYDAIKKNEKIVVHGDYDVDGVCGSVLLVSTLKEVGAKNVSVYLPHREAEGYGLNMDTVRKLSEEGVKLIITVDCGVSNAPEVALARELGMKVIILDHHTEPPTLAPADAILCPTLSRDTYPWRYLCGAGVAFKFAQILGPDEAFLKWNLDLVALATVCDYMPLLNENRTFVKWGLLVLQKTRRLGLQKLFDQAGLNMKRIEIRDIGWKIGPRINAAGRIDHANTAYQLLLSENESEAQELAEKIESTNTDRQALSTRIHKEALQEVESQSESMLLFAHGKDWPLGVLGLVASKICDQFSRPVLLLTTNRGEISGSGRSIEGFNLITSLQKCKEYFSRFGGHAGAAGFTLKQEVNIRDFETAFRALAEETLRGKSLQKKLEIECEINIEEITWDLYEYVSQFEPYGEGNHRPRFLVKNLSIENFDVVGNGNGHIRLWAGGKKFIGFSMGEWSRRLSANDIIDIVFEIGVNQWNGNRELQLKIVDLKKSFE